MCSFVKLFCYLEAKTKHEFKAWILYGYVVPSHNTCKIDQWEKDILDEKLLLCEIKCYTKNSDQFFSAMTCKQEYIITVGKDTIMINNQFQEELQVISYGLDFRGDIHDNGFGNTFKRVSFSGISKIETLKFLQQKYGDNERDNIQSILSIIQKNTGLYLSTTHSNRIFNIDCYFELEGYDVFTCEVDNKDNNIYIKNNKLVSYPVIVNFICADTEASMRNQSLFLEDFNKRIGFNTGSRPRSAKIEIWNAHTGKLVYSNIISIICNIDYRLNIDAGNRIIADEWIDKLEKTVGSSNKKPLKEKLDMVKHNSCKSRMTSQINLWKSNISAQIAVYANKIKCEGAFVKKVNAESEIDSFLYVQKLINDNDVECVWLMDPYFSIEAIDKLFTRISNCDTKLCVITSLKNIDPDIDDECKADCPDYVKKVETHIKQNARCYHPNIEFYNITRAGNTCIHDRYLIRQFEDGSIDGFLLSNSLNSAGQTFSYIVAPMTLDTAYKAKEYIFKLIDCDDGYGGNLEKKDLFHHNIESVCKKLSYQSDMESIIDIKNFIKNIEEMECQYKLTNNCYNDSYLDYRGYLDGSIECSALRYFNNKCYISYSNCTQMYELYKIVIQNEPQYLVDALEKFKSPMAMYVIINSYFNNDTVIIPFEKLIESSESKVRELGYAYIVGNIKKSYDMYKDIIYSDYKLCAYVINACEGNTRWLDNDEILSDLYQHMSEYLKNSKNCTEVINYLFSDTKNIKVVYGIYQNLIESENSIKDNELISQIIIDSIPFDDNSIFLISEIDKYRLFIDAVYQIYGSKPINEFFRIIKCDFKLKNKIKEPYSEFYMNYNESIKGINNVKWSMFCCYEFSKLLNRDGRKSIKLLDVLNELFELLSSKNEKSDFLSLLDEVEKYIKEIQPKISIVLPSYNGSKYIRESIDSILSQNFSDWELIIVNDCSTDNTLDIAKEYAAKDNRITVINNEVNQKLPASLNIGFRQAKGDYLTWTSDDNIYKPNALQEMYEFLECNPNYKMVCCDMDTIDSEGKVTGVRDNFDPVYMHYNNCVGACFMYHREVLDTVGEYTIGKFCVEDYDYWLRIMRHYGTIGYLHKNLYYYRVHEDSLSSTKRILIRQQLLKLWYENLEWHLAGLYGIEDLLWDMYYRFYSVEIDVDFKKVEDVFSKYLPLNKFACRDLPENCKFAIWGAGFYGKLCKKILKDRAICFIDSNKSITGQNIDGLHVIHSSQLDIIEEDCNIIIAVSPQNVMDVYYGIEKQYRSRVVVCHKFIGKEIFDIHKS